VLAWLEGWQRSIDQWVLLPYANHLEPVGAWWVQLVAESLGKLGADGVRRGITPIRAVGPQDQHAQLQRWLDGPRNVGVVLATVSFGLPADPCDLPAQCPFPGLGALGGCTVLRAQADGTREALRAAGVPVLQWDLGPLDAFELGALFMAWQMIVALTGFGLGVDPFDQPAVEDGKRRTLNLLGLG
jgi:glucose-6-phosphate isomerase